SDVVMLEEAPHRAAAARNLVPVHRQNRLVQGQVWPSRNQTQQKICMLLQRRDAPAPRLSRTAARLPKALDPDNRRAGTDIKLLGRRAPRRPAFNFRNHSRPHVFRIGLRHRPASQNRINADRLSHPSPSENLLDSIGTEHALALSILLNNINALSAISSCNLPRIGSWEERGKKRRRLPGSDGKENQDFALYGLANGAAAHCSSYGSAHSYGARGARQRSGGVEKYSSITSRQAPEHGSAASSPGPDPRISAAIFSAQLM